MSIKKQKLTKLQKTLHSYLHGVTRVQTNSSWSISFSEVHLKCVSLEVKEVVVHQKADFDHVLSFPTKSRGEVFVSNEVSKSPR